MKTLTEITNIIAKQIGEVAKTAATDYDIIVCPERIFMDDYLPEEERYLAALGEMPSLDADSPQDLPYRNTIFVVIKMGSGQANMGVSNYSCTLQVLSEADDFVAARQLLDSFIAEYNFEYVDGIVQSYFTPDMGGSQESVYTGFRALMSCRGNIRVPEEGVVFVTDILASFDGKIFFEIPFLNVMYNHACQPDPQAFAGTNGRTMALNRQSTQTITLDMYLWNSGEYSEQNEDEAAKAFLPIGARLSNNWHLDRYSAKVVEAHSEMNKKFYLMVRTSIKSGGDMTASGINMCKIASGIFRRTTSYDESSGLVGLIATADTSTLYQVKTLDMLNPQNILVVADKNVQESTYQVSKVSSIDNRYCIFDGWFVLTNAAYNQAWGDASSWSITFTSALEEEK